MDTPSTHGRRRVLRLGAVTTAIAATLLAGGAASAQTQGPNPGDPEAQRPGYTRGDIGFGGPGRQGGGQRNGGLRGGVMDVARDAVTVTASDGTSLTLETPDGWTRSIDTTGVVLTKDATVIPLSDIAVGDRVRIEQTRNADGTYTVTGIELLPDLAQGTVAEVATDSFTLTLADGTTQTVHVTPATVWNVLGSTTPGITDLVAGRAVVAVGQLEADGSLDATRVVAR